MAGFHQNSNDREPAGEVRAQLQRALVALLTEYHGRGPSRAKVFVDENVVTCVFEQPFTWAERRLIDSGQEEHVHRGRVLLRQEQAERISALVEEATGRRPAWALRAFKDAEADVRESIRLIRESPYLLSREVRGTVYDVATGRLTEVR